MVRFEGSHAVFDDGSEERYDAVVMATGYRCALPFFSDAVRRQLEFEQVGIELLRV